MPAPEVLFDLWYVMVEVVFGSVWLSGIAVIAMMLIIGAISKMSFVLISVLIIAFALVFFVNYYGTAILMIAYLFAMIYFGMAMWNFISRYR